MKILVMGATGQVGGAAVRALVADAVPVCALVRNPAQAAGLNGVEIVPGSFEDDAAVTRALDGVDTMLLTGRDSPDTVPLQRNVLKHVEQSSVRHVVKLSAIGARADSPVALMRDHHAVDEVLRMSSKAWTLLQPHLFMQNLLRAADTVRSEGRLPAPMADRRIPLVDTRDVGMAAAAVLRNPSAHIGKAYRLTGPEAYSYADVASVLSTVVGHPVRYEAIPPKSFEAQLIAAGIPGWRAFDLAHIASAYSEGEYDVSPDFEALVGRRPTSLSDFLQSHSEVFIG